MEKKKVSFETRLRSSERKRADLESKHQENLQANERKRAALKSKHQENLLANERKHDRKTTSLQIQQLEGLKTAILKEKNKSATEREDSIQNIKHTLETELATVQNELNAVKEDLQEQIHLTKNEEPTSRSGLESTHLTSLVVVAALNAGINRYQLCTFFNGFGCTQHPSESTFFKIQGSVAAHEEILRSSQQSVEKAAKLSLTYCKEEKKVDHVHGLISRRRLESLPECPRTAPGDHGRRQILPSRQVRIIRHNRADCLVDHICNRYCINAHPSYRMASRFFHEIERTRAVPRKHCEREISESPQSKWSIKT
ncbi:hypothetical protein DFS34DRAFT_302651 [Phlyctochytrium arcticum]|nr:hypothetical protein DFS34DRAFT_302651 [Phlyctochytrium arcticum]